MKSKHILLALSVMFVLASCKKDVKEEPVLNLDKTDVSLQFGGTSQVTASTEETVVWTSDNTDVATVSSSGLVTARKIGSTIIKAKSSSNLIGECIVRVNARSQLFDEPFFQRGAPISYVKKNETRSVLEETPDMLIFEGESPKIKYVIYYFNATGMYGVSVKINGTLTEAIVFIEERYRFLGEEEGISYYDYDENTVISISPDIQSGVNVYYYDATAK